MVTPGAGRPPPSDATVDGFEDLVCLTELSLVLMSKLEIRGVKIILWVT